MHVLIVGAYGSAGGAAADVLSEAVGNEISKLTLVDNGEPGGGLCILRGCMPSKAVLSTAKTVYQTESDSRISGSSDIDLQSTIEHKDRHITEFAKHKRGSVHSMQGKNIDFVQSEANILSENKVKLGNEMINPDYTIVATGSRPRIPDIDSIEEVDNLTGADILDKTELPDSVVVMGFGAVGMEMSAYLSACGVDVTVIEHDTYPMDDASDEFGRELINIYRDKFNIDILTNTYEQKIENTKNGVSLHVDTEEDEKQEIEADRLCTFTGRTPNTELLNSMKDVTIEPSWVKSTQRIRGTESLYAAGDVTGDNMILHIAKEEGRTAAQNILRQINRLQSGIEYHPMTHRVYFTGVGKYPYVRVGKSASQGRDDGDIVVTRSPSDDGIFKLKDADEGLAALTVENNGENGFPIKGYEGIHLNADVMAKTAQMMVQKEMDVRKVPSVAYHPTTPELLDGLIRKARKKSQKVLKRY